jgi:hypothetical protein
LWAGVPRWESLDGINGWAVDATIVSAPGGLRLHGTGTASLNEPSYDYLTKLTTDPAQLLAKIYKETRGQGTSPDEQAFTTIGDLLTESYPPANLNAALYKAAARIPGVVLVSDATDATGRHGVAVARTDEATGRRIEWSFDRRTSVFLGERTVQTKPAGSAKSLVKPGTVVSSTAVLARAVVNGIKQTP